jgi:hypothetical protein
MADLIPDKLAKSIAEVEAELLKALTDLAPANLAGEKWLVRAGQLSDDWNEVARIASGQRAPIAYALVWLSSLLRFIGSKLVS